MSDAELQKLIDDISGQLGQLADDPEKPLDKAERRRRAVLRASLHALERAKAAAAAGDEHKEARARLDYSLLTEYGEKHPLLFYYVRAQLGWGLWW
jgi:hypothetical protein